MEIHGLHGVARVKEMKMAHCISHALGHPRTVGGLTNNEVVSLENCFRGLTNNIIYRSMSTTISEGCPHNINRRSMLN